MIIGYTCELALAFIAGTNIADADEAWTLHAGGISQATISRAAQMWLLGALVLVGILIPVYKSTSSYTSVYSSIRQTVWPLFSAYCRKLLSTLPAMLGSMPFLLPFFWLRSTSNARSIQRSSFGELYILHYSVRDPARGRFYRFCSVPWSTLRYNACPGWS